MDAIVVAPLIYVWFVRVGKIATSSPKCQSHLAGINPYYENGMSSFQILKDLIPLCVRFGLDGEVAKDLEKAVNASHYYFRSYYKYELTWQNSCRWG